jgi:hypothetical protein
MIEGVPSTAALATSERLNPTVVLAGVTSKADQIRALARAGYLRTEIAALLEIRYQHVRQVLERSGINLGRQRESGTVGAPRRAPVAGPAPAPRTAALPGSILTAAGFVQIGRWIANGEGAFALDCVAPHSPGVYAFVVDGIIRYIGLSQRTLRGRMGHYVRGHARQRTSARIKRLILEALSEGQVIDVLVATPAPMEWNGLPVLTAPGLEAGLIRMIQPEWNMQGLG